MAHFPMVDRFRKRRSTTGDPVLDTLAHRPLTGRRSALTPGALRRERRALLHARDVRIRDLGGLMLEMYRRDQYREELVFEQCSELVDLEQRILELNVRLAAASTGRRPLSSSRCACGAPVVAGAHFCAHCGRPAGEPVVECPLCGHPLAADAIFCAACGTSALGLGAPALGDVPGNGDGRAPGADSEESASTGDPWER